MRQKLSYGNIFLIDGIGALLTATLLSQVLARWVPVFGMPRDVLHILALIACGFALYSFSCHFWLKTKQPAFLSGIAIANILYCLLTLGLALYLRESLTWLGMAYFAGEILIVMSLARLEIQLAKNGPAPA